MDKKSNGLFIDPIFNTIQFHVWSSNIEYKEHSDWYKNMVVWKAYFDKPESARICCEVYGFVKAVRKKSYKILWTKKLIMLKSI